MTRRGLAVALVLVMSVSAACSTQKPRPPGPDPAAGAKVVGEKRKGRRLDLTIRSAALRRTAKVRLLLPPGWSKRAKRTWPTLWLLHGGGEDHRSWTAKTDVAELTKDGGAIIVMPDGGKCGSYSNWWNFGKGGPPRWETFHTEELRGILERHYRAGGRRAIAGFSMGGQGAMLYAARKRGMFKAAASFSGALDILDRRVQTVSRVATMGYCFTDSRNLWGDPEKNRDIWERHNPYHLAERLRGVKLHVSAGTDPPFESITHEVAERFVRRLRELDIPVQTHFGQGGHDFANWQRALHRAYPMLMKAIDAPRVRRSE